MEDMNLKYERAEPLYYRVEFAAESKQGDSIRLLADVGDPLITNFASVNKFPGRTALISRVSVAPALDTDLQDLIKVAMKAELIFRLNGAVIIGCAIMMLHCQGAGSVQIAPLPDLPFGDLPGDLPVCLAIDNENDEIQVEIVCHRDLELSKILKLYICFDCWIDH